MIAKLILESIRLGINDYLENNKLCMIFPNEKGTRRAERISNLLDNYIHPNRVNYLLLSILYSDSKKLKQKIANRIALSGIYRYELPKKLKIFHNYTKAIISVLIQQHQFSITDLTTLTQYIDDGVSTNYYKCLDILKG